MIEPTMLTTVDNPFNPFTQWGQWFAFDSTLGYNTCGLLDRVAKTTDELNDGQLQFAKQQIVRLNISGKHILVTERNFTSMVKTESNP